MLANLAERRDEAYQRIGVKPIAGAIGAEIDGVDIAADLDDGVIAEIRQALLDHLVIFFHGQSIDTETQKAFARRFGDIFIHPNFDFGVGDPEILMLERAPGEVSVNGEQWHADTTMMAEPPMGAILYALETPPYGSDTLFANQYAAYDALSDGMKTMLAGLKAVHSDRRVAGPGVGKNAVRTTKVREDADWRETVSAHPVVRTHPETGRKSLFVNEIYCLRFDGMTEEESAPLLDYLYAHARRPEFTCRFAWRPGDVAFWDNRCLMHLALNDNNRHRRLMRRVQIAGGPVV